MIVQLQRLSDGKRRVTSVAEITGMEGDIVQMQEIYRYVRTGDRRPTARSKGNLLATGVRPRFLSELAARGIKHPGALFRPQQAAVSLMPFEINSVYVVYLFIALAAGLFAEGIYLLFFTARSYRKNVNRRLRLMEHQPDRESMLVQLRRERGLSTAGDYRLPLVRAQPADPAIRPDHRAWPSLAIYVGVGAVVAFGGLMFTRGNLLEALGAALFCGTLLPLLVLKIKRGRRQKVVRRAVPRRARHHRAQPARRPSGADRHRHGGARDARPDRQRVRHRRRRNHLRRGSRDRHAQPLLPHRPGRPAAVRHRGRQSRASTGGNLGEILQNLSSVIRERFKMRRKIRALAAEGRASALILSSLPILDVPGRSR